MFADVVFPQKVGSLTYSLPEGYPEDLEGRLVEAPLRTSNPFGLILSVSRDPTLTDPRLRNRSVVFKSLSAVHEILFQKTRLDLLRWLSSYYLASMGTALDAMFFDEMVQTARPAASAERKRPKRTAPVEPDAPSSFPADLPELGADDRISLVSRAVDDARYQAFLLHAPSRVYEHRFLMELLTRTAGTHSGILVLVPEISRIELLAPLLKAAWGDRLCVLHGKLSKRQRAETVKGIIGGRTDIVLGTRSAVLAPVGRASLIIVTEEHHPSYKAEEGLRCHARDVGVMRAFIEGATVLLSSVSPSLETHYNTMKGKYLLLTDTDYCVIPGAPPLASSDGFPRRPHAHSPGVRVVDMRRAGTSSPVLPSDVIRDLRRIIGSGGKVLILADRKGYSMLRCAECGHIFRCPRCDASLVFSRDRALLRCGRCRFESAVPLSCAACGGVSIEGIGTGTEKLRESLAGIFSEEPVLIEKRPVKTRVREVSPRNAQNARFIIGTSYAGKGVRDMSLGAAVLMNVDSLLSQPHFRAYEHAFQEISDVIQLVKPSGTVYVATRMPGNPVVRHVRSRGYLTFLHDELAERARLGYPPFSRIALLSVESKSDHEELAETLEDMAEEARTRMLDVMGPVEVNLPRRKDRRALQMVLRSPDRRMLHDGARRLVTRLQVVKGVSVTVDVDPLKI